MREALLVFVEHIRKFRQQFVHFQQQVVEIHSAGFETAVLVFGKEFFYFGAAAAFVVGDEVDVFSVFFGIDQRVFCRRDAVEYGSRFIEFIVQSFFLDDAFQQALAVVGIVDGEIVGIAHAVCFGAQDAGEHRVEGTHV